jgi:fructose-specific phosphotransferase system component IIB
VDIEIEKRERFQNLRIIQVPVQEAIKNPAAVFMKIQG